MTAIPVADFWDDALCREFTTETFFVGKGGSVQDAKLICRNCPVTARCLEWALSMPDHMDQYGIFGGKSPRQRRAMRNARQVTP